MVLSATFPAHGLNYCLMFKRAVYGANARARVTFIRPLSLVFKLRRRLQRLFVGILLVFRKLLPYQNRPRR